MKYILSLNNKELSEVCNKKLSEVDIKPFTGKEERTLLGKVKSNLRAHELAHAVIERVRAPVYMCHGAFSFFLLLLALVAEHCVP